MSELKVSVIIPVVREDRINECLEAAKANHGLEDGEVEFIVERDVDGIGCPKMVKKLVEKTNAPLVCFLGDDTIPQPGYLQMALEAMKSLPDEWGVVGLNDETKRILPTHWVADKRMLPLIGGDFFYTGYKHLFCDNELFIRSSELKKYVHCPEAVVKHLHPLFCPDLNLQDKFYDSVYNHKSRYLDRIKFFQRATNNWEFPDRKLGIVFPITDSKVYKNFFLSFLTIDKPERYVLVAPDFPINNANIDEVRNYLVQNAIDGGCTHVLMMDTDQIYPEETIQKMWKHMDNGLRVVGGAVHRRYPPFDVIAFRGKPGRYKHVSDEEIYSGNLINVDATGAACVMYDITIFAEVEPPWFWLGEDEKKKPIGEDIAFCHSLREAGIPIYLDTSLEIGHITDFVVNRGAYEVFKLTNRFAWADPDDDGGDLVIRRK